MSLADPLISMEDNFVPQYLSPTKSYAHSQGSTMMVAAKVVVTRPTRVVSWTILLVAERILIQLSAPMFISSKGPESNFRKVVRSYDVV